MLQQQECQYQIGDWVVHSEHGVGQVKEQEKRFRAGEDKDFLKVVTFTGIFWFPAGKADAMHMRPVASVDEMDQALAALEEPPENLPDTSKERDEAISRAKGDISLQRTVKIIRDLHGESIFDEITTAEELFLIKFKKEFANELSVVKGGDIEKAEEIMENALAVGVSKVTD